MAEHAQTPWRFDGNWLVSAKGGIVLSYTTADDGLHGEPADKEFIVRAVNSHEKLVSALEKWAAYDNCDAADFTQSGPMLLYAEAIEATREALVLARSALSEEGKKE